MFTFGAKANPKIAIAPGEIRVEKATTLKKPKPLPSKTTSRATQLYRKTAQPPPSKTRLSPVTSDRLDPNATRKRKASRQKSPAQQKFDDSSSEDESGSPAPSYNFPEKRQKSDSPVDLKRQLRADRLFSLQDSEILIHAADVANRNDNGISIELQYPAATQREKYIITAYRILCCQG